ncbi:T9SS-dependent choice-of-anchor J family protein [Prevotella falsenii]|uniref:T9SS-dependent choice-of-anchor J family protein n=1 Tax=Prevotella falsenii TaxID=515414 RepID=UPI00046953D6|nr:choice-of-anchor J domain-containing protein [Prevotella falsenii]
MKKKLLIVLSILFGINSLCSAQPLKTGIHENRVPIYNVPDGEAEICGYLRYDMKYRTNGLTGFRTDFPNKYTLIKDYGTILGKTPVFTAGTYVENKYIAYETTLYSNVLMPKGISIIDPITGEYESKTTFPENTPILILDEMTYDPKTQKIFGMHYDTDKFTTDLYEINNTTFALAKVATINKPFFTLSADNGFLYAVTCERDIQKSFLVKINQSSIDAGKQTCTVETISPATGTGINIGNYSQSMEFDKTTHRLWWAAQAADGKSYLVELNPETGTSMSQKLIVDELQLLSMAISYQYVADEAPSFVKGLAIKAGEQGANNATLSWTTPTLNYRNKSLTTIDGIKIYRNNELVKTLNMTGKGEQMTWKDTELSEGYYIYKVVPYNTHGDGVYKEAAAFVGEDVPGAPVNVKLVANGTEGTITWNEPTTGAHDGYFDNSTLTYDVMRLPDSVKIVTGTAARSVKDNVKSHAGYSYVVTACNKKGKGLSATSNIVAFGSIETIPFISSLGAKDEFDKWTIIDNNQDGMSWSFNETSACAMYDRSEKSADDWLVSPPLAFSKNKKYQLRYTYFSANWIDPATHKPVMEKMKVFYGTQPTPEKLSTLIKDLEEFHTSSGNYYYGKDLFTPSETGNGHIAFHACSEALKGQIFLKDVSLREYSEKDLSIKELKGSITANCNVEQSFIATIGNEGSATVNDYVVELFNTDTQEVLGSAKGSSITPDATTTTMIYWTPKTEGEVNVSARVVLAGDTYPADNALTKPLKVKVAAADADMWLTLNTDVSSGWVMPFYLLSPYAQAQCLYLENEIRKKNIDITAIQFKYNGKNNSPYTFPAKISMKTTERNNMKAPDSGYLGFFDTTDWTKVYEGNITLEGTGENKELKIVFDTPFKYMGGNVIFKFEALPGDNVLTGSQHPEWHFDMPKGDARSAKYDNKTETINEKEIFISEYIPFLMLEYKDNNPAGILTIGNNSFKVIQKNNMLYASSVCNRIEIMNISGATIMSAKNTDKINIETIPAGIYLLKATENGITHTIKILKK